MAVVLLPGDDDFCAFLKIVVNTQTDQEHAGQLWIEAIVDIQIVVIQQEDVLLYCEGEKTRVNKSSVQHCVLQVAGIVEPKNQRFNLLCMLFER